MKMVIFKRKHMWKNVLLTMFLMFAIGMPVKASNLETTMTLQQTVKDADIKEEPDKSAETLKSVEKRTGVIVYGEPQDSWSQVEYDGVKGYMESGALEAYMTEEKVEELEEEFNEVGEETVRTVEEAELVQKSKRTSAIWRTVIVILVGAIFVVGVISAIKNDKGEETGRAGEEKEGA